MSSSSSPLAPTFYGHIASTQDALLLFEACLSGALGHVARRPHDRERANLIKSGNVFIYEEHSSGIKRWTDGVPWSPSRILGNFLVYRELERPFPPGEKKRAMKKSKRSPGISKSESYSISNSSVSTGYNPAVAVVNSTFETPNGNSLSKETERSLIGSLVDSYGFKEEGLVKKTVSVTVGSISHHLVSYYTVADVMNNKFTTPSKDPRFQNIVPRQELVSKQNFRTPIDEVDAMDRAEDRSVYTYPYSARGGYEMTNQTISQQRSLSLPTPPHIYSSGNAGVFGNYSVGNQGNSYDGIPTSQSAPTFTNHLTSSQGMYSTPIKHEGFHLPGYRQQRFNSVSGISSETNRSHMPSAISNFARRPSNYEQVSSIDSGINASSSESKPSSEQGYSQQNNNPYNSLREVASTQNNYTPQRSLPTPSQSQYERNSVQVYHHPVENMGLKESMWSMGNVNAGHGHYIGTPQHITTPQQWASTGTS